MYTNKLIYVCVVYSIFCIREQLQHSAAHIHVLLKLKTFVQVIIRQFTKN